MQDLQSIAADLSGSGAAAGSATASGNTSGSTGTSATANPNDALMQQIAQAVATYMQSMASQAGTATGSVTSIAT